MTELESRTPSEPGRIERQDGVAWLVLDAPGKKVNTLSSSLVDWFERALDELERDRPRGVVILSGKPDQFVAGADLEELVRLDSAEAIVRLVERGHSLISRLEALGCPTVAAIDGPCLGGGLELALGCRFRVATDSAKTRLGLPEVQLGLIPGLGGTQRLPRRIGVAAALDLILTGRQIDARKAARLGLIDEACPPTRLRAAALRWIERGRAPRRVRSVSRLATDFAARVPALRELVFGRARRSVLAKTGGHYPAPLVAIEVMRTGIGYSLPRALRFEAGAFAEIATSETAKNLIGLFFAKNEVEGRAAQLARHGREVTRVGVLGAGFMGAGIAQGYARKGWPVVLKDRDLGALSRGLKQTSDLFTELVVRRRTSETEAKAAQARVHGTTDYAACRGLDFVVEAVFEDLAVKHAVLREVEEVASADLIFASNTSTLPIAEIALASRRPENVVGMHFFSPVHKMPLLEVIRHPATSEEALATTVEMGRVLGKTVVVVNDGPGFLTTRVLAPLLNEAAWCLVEGASVEQIDRSMTRWGWPVGPLTLLDEVGLDIAGHAGEVMLRAFGERFAPPPVLSRLLADGRRGRKAKRGFYLYGPAGKQPDAELYALLDWKPAPANDEEIVDRCWLSMLNETARAMDEGIAENPADIDLAVLFGFGFPPFRGGLLREADRRGSRWVVDRLSALAERHGPRLNPAPRLLRMAEAGERFYS